MKEKIRYISTEKEKRRLAEIGSAESHRVECLKCEKVKPESAFMKSRPDTCRKCIEKGRTRDPDKRAASRRRYQASHREMRAAKAVEFIKNNTDVVRARDRSRRAEKRIWEREFYAKNPEKRAVRNAIYHHRTRSAKGECSAAQLRGRFSMFGNKCAYCGGLAEAADHVIPVSRGGTNWPSNFRPACTTCNSSKGSRLLQEWKRVQVEVNPKQKESRNGEASA